MPKKAKVRYEPSICSKGHKHTGRIVKKGKRGAIDQLSLPILKRLNLNTEEWLARSCTFKENHHQFLAKRRSIKKIR